MFDHVHDARVRAATFEWLADQVDRHDDVLPRDLLAEGFQYLGERVPLLGPQGIFKPRVLDEVPLSLTTIPGGPYDDGFGSGDLMEYRYRGTDPFHTNNVWVRNAMERRLPLVYFHRIIPGKYLAAWPVFVVGDEPESLTFLVAFDDTSHIGLEGQDTWAGGFLQEDDNEGRRIYVTSVVRRRVHQRSFRERVLAAYRRQCAFCRLRHEELLDAAHIIADVDPAGEPVVNNGLALCKLHHAAFDKYFIGVRPDHTLEVRVDLLGETDGPTLVHAIQSLHGEQIVLPRRQAQWPSVDRLEERYESFLARQRAS